MAGAHDVASFGVKYLNDEAGFWRAVTRPVLLWRAAPEQREPPLLFGTRSGGKTRRALAGRPVFFVVEKSVKNAFAVEVTVGRTANNDITIEDNSVSRFHAYFAPGQKGGLWSLIDAKSTTGTYVAGERLHPKVPAPLVNGVLVRIGDVELQFLEPSGLWRFLQRMISKPK